MNLFFVFFLLSEYLFYVQYKGWDSNEIGLSKEQLEHISNKIGYKPDPSFSVKDYIPDLKHPFLKWVLTEYEHVRAATYQNEWSLHFTRLITELQELRNAEVHSGRVNPYANTKLKGLVPTIMMAIRGAVIQACKDNETMTLDEVLNEVSK